MIATVWTATTLMTNHNDANLEENNLRENKFVILNTNARSITPKINSFIDTFRELEASIAIITETWLADGPSLADDIQDLVLGTGIDLISRNRPPAVNGGRHRLFGLQHQAEEGEYPQS